MYSFPNFVATRFASLIACCARGVKLGFGIIFIDLHAKLLNV